MYKPNRRRPWFIWAEARTSDSIDWPFELPEAVFCNLLGGKGWLVVGGQRVRGYRTPSEAMVELAQAVSHG